MSAFEELGVCPEIIRAIEDDGWLLPTAIQSDCIPYILNGQDVCAAAETGSGKTGAFGLPCLQIVHETLRQKAVTTGVTKRSQSKQTGFNLNDKDPFVVVSPDLLESKSTEASRWSGIRCHGDISGGRYQWEVDILGDGLMRVGVSISVATLELGKDNKGWGYGGTAKKSWNSKFDDYGLKYGNGDTITVMLDREDGSISYAKNGQNLGPAFELPQELHKQPLQPHVCGKGFHCRIRLDNLVYPQPGYQPLAQIQDEHSIQAMAQSLNTIGKGKRLPMCLVLEPTRDLALQTYNCMKHFSKYLEAPEVRVTLCVGGVDERRQKEELQTGTDIVVGTIPKIGQWEGKRELSLESLKFLVLDEADSLITNDDRKSIPRFKQNATRTTGRNVQTLFFSATLHSPEVKKAIDALTFNPVWVDLKGRPTVPETVHAVVYLYDPTKPVLTTPPNPSVKPTTDGVHARDRLDPSSPEQLSQKVKFHKPQIAVHIADKLKMVSCMIFCRTNLDCNNFEQYLNTLGGSKQFSGKVEGGKENPYSCVVMAGMRDQAERIRNLQHFKDGDVRFLICTDVAARGIDIKELPHMIMMTLPDETDQWFHRVGRVGRADNMGLAISIVSTVKEKVWFHKCNNRGGIGCTNTKLTNQGGCCVWFDEPLYFETLQSRLPNSLPVMDPKSLSVEGILDIGNERSIRKEEKRERKTKASVVIEGVEPVKSLAVGSMTMYGKQRDDVSTRQTVQRLEELLPAAQRLAEMEAHIQAMFVVH